MPPFSLILLIAMVTMLVWGLPQDTISVNAELDHCVATCRAKFNPYTQPTDYYNCVADCKKKFPTRDL